MKFSKLLIFAICLTVIGIQRVNGQTSVAASQIIDTDGDGVADPLDEYPTDAQKAFNNYSSKGAGATLVFEDQWPMVGDFDMNDLVIEYKYNVITNAKNIVVKVIADYKLKAGGGDFADGFGVEFPVPAKAVRTVIGANLEEGQEKAVIVLFTNMHNQLETPNIDPNVPRSAPKDYHVIFDVVDGPSLYDFGLDYNPFLFTMYGSSRREVHLVGKTPTTLADHTLFGTGDDDTNLASGRSYITKNGFPYAISIPVTGFEYPVARKDIGHAYTHLVDWALSGGKSYQDWYYNSAQGYRNESFIYSK